MLLAALTISAQSGKWSAGTEQADELKGQVGSSFFKYEVEGEGSFIVYDWNDWAFKIATSKGKFDVRHYPSNGVAFVNVSLGLYSFDDKLIDSISDVPLLADVFSCSAWINKKGIYYPKTRRKLRSMIKALKAGARYVRILSARVDAPALDMKIMPYTNATDGAGNRN